MPLLDDLRTTVGSGKVLQVQVGLFWTGVLVETDTGIACGLAAALRNPEGESEHRPALSAAGHLQELNCQDLMTLVHSESRTEVSVGLATINALLPRDPCQWQELNGADYIVQHGTAKNVAVVGHFPFVEKLRPCFKQLWVLELNPHGDDLPAARAPEAIPQADLIAITATTLINRTFDGLMALCRSDAEVMLLGPSTPLSPLLFSAGLDVLSGTIVEDPRRVLQAISQGCTFGQLVHLGGVRLVTMKRPGAPQGIRPHHDPSNSCAGHIAPASGF